MAGAYEPPIQRNVLRMSDADCLLRSPANCPWAKAMSDAQYVDNIYNKNDWR